jgi:hypothetical protein
MWTKEEVKKYNAEYYIKNSDKIKNQASSWSTKNPEKRLSISKNWARNNPEKRVVINKKYNETHERSKRDHNYRQDFGLTIEDYDKMLETQNGQCGVCGSTTPNKKGFRNLFVDHNHVTGLVRGLLCHKCNTALGLLKTDEQGIANLEKAIQYLKKEVK